MDNTERFKQIALKYMNPEGYVSFQDRIAIHREWIDGLEFDETCGIDAKNKEVFEATKNALSQMFKIVYEIAEEHQVQGKKLYLDLEDL